MTLDATRGPRPGQLQPPLVPPAAPAPAAQAPPPDASRPATAADQRVAGSGPADALDAAEDVAAAASAAAAVAMAALHRRPDPDAGKTWGGPDSPRDLNFGHAHTPDGHLFRRDASGAVVWADNGKAVTPAQWANMPAAQQQKVLTKFPEAAEALAGGDPAEARRPAPPPEAPADPDLVRRLRAGLANANTGVVHGCFRYAWATTDAAGGKPLGQAPEDALYKRGRHDLADLPQLVEAGKVRPGDIVYANTSPGADPQSLDLSYGPHWFVYMGGGQWADQYGVKSLAEMQETIPGRQLDTIFHPF